MITIDTPADMFREAEEFMKAHGCAIKKYETYCTVVFPEGTTRVRIRPTTPGGERFTLILPDGCVMREVYVRYLEQSVLYHPEHCTRTNTSSVEAVQSWTIEHSIV